MKIRQGFVSNSSSCSFFAVLFPPDADASILNIKKTGMVKDIMEDEELSFDEIKKEIEKLFNKLIQKKKMHDEEDNFWLLVECLPKKYIMWDLEMERLGVSEIKVLDHNKILDILNSKP
jgi:hypothetical protein